MVINANRAKGWRVDVKALVMFFLRPWHVGGAEAVFGEVGRGQLLDVSRRQGLQGLFLCVEGRPGQPDAFQLTYFAGLLLDLIVGVQAFGDDPALGAFQRFVFGESRQEHQERPGRCRGDGVEFRAE